MTTLATRAAAAGLSRRRAAAVAGQAERMTNAVMSGHRLVAIDAMLRCLALGAADHQHRAALSRWVAVELTRTEHAADHEHEPPPRRRHGRPPAASVGAS